MLNEWKKLYAMFFFLVLEHFKRMWLFTMDAITGIPFFFTTFCFLQALIVLCAFQNHVLNYAPYPYCCGHALNPFVVYVWPRYFRWGARLTIRQTFTYIFFCMFLDNYIDNISCAILTASWDCFILINDLCCPCVAVDTSNRITLH